MQNWFKSIFNCYSNKLSSHSQLDEIASTWKKHVEEDKLDSLFSEIHHYSDSDLLKVKARKYADSIIDTYSKSLIQYIEAELSYRMTKTNYYSYITSAVLSILALAVSILVALFK